MNWKMLCVSLACAALLPGCQGTGGDGYRSEQVRPPSCDLPPPNGLPKCVQSNDTSTDVNNGSCYIEIQVASDGSSCAPVPDPVAFGNPGHAKCIYWKITGTSGYQFPKHGIAFKPSNVITIRHFKDNFSDHDSSPDGQWFWWRNNHNLTRSSFPYTVTVVDPSGTFVCTKDPIIFNR